MTSIIALVKKDLLIASTYETQKGIENHKKAALHFEAAAKHHRDAAKYHEAGNEEKAAQSTLTAEGHAILANEAQEEDVKHHAISN